MELSKYFKFFCHQKDERCFYFGNEKSLVCARCSGMYVAFLITFLMLFLFHGFFTKLINFLPVVVMFIPLSIDGLTQSLNMRASTNTLRFVTGYFAGIGLAYLLYGSLSFVLSSGYFLSRVPQFEYIVSLLIFALLLSDILKKTKKHATFLKHLFSMSAFFSIAVLFASLIILYGWLALRMLNII